MTETATLIPLDNVDPALVEALLDRAFEPERKARTAYKLRDGIDWLPGLSFAAINADEHLVGTIQCWPVALNAEGRAYPLIMVGPVAVTPEAQGGGYGKALMSASLAAIDPRAPLPQVMVGDPEYYGRFWGFSAEHTGGWTLPGPWDPRRLLARGDAAATLPAKARWGLGAARPIWHRAAVPYEPPPELAALSLAEIAAMAAARKLPPVGEWDPQASSDSLMWIARDGRWFHDGGEIKRPAMVRAFASLLRRDADGRHWLVTPYEKQSIEVEDAAFIAVDVMRQDGALIFRLNTDDVVVAGPDHPLCARGSADLPAIYLAVRAGAEARLNRSTWLQLVELADDDLAVESQRQRFSLVP